MSMTTSRAFLFFGIRPPPGLADAIDDVRRDFGLDRSYDKDRLHITLAPLGYRDLVGEGALAAARTAADAIRHPAFRIVFDRVEGGILRGSEPIRGLIAFQRTLSRALAAHGVGSVRHEPFRPHVTLTYKGAPGSYSIDGISWLADEFVLIQSLQRASQHELLGRWRLYCFDESRAGKR